MDYCCKQGPTVDYTINILQCFRDRGRKTEGEDLGGTYVIVQIHFS